MRLPAWADPRKWNRQRRLVGAGVVVALVFALVGAIAASGAPDVSNLPVAEQMAADTSEWTKKERTGSEYLEHLKDGKVYAVGVGSNALAVSLRDGTKYFVTDARGAFAAVTVDAAKEAETTPEFVLTVLPSLKAGIPKDTSVLSMIREFAPLLIPLAMLGLLVRMLGGESIAGAKLVTKAPKTRFADVIGAGEAKDALKDIVAYLKAPEKFTAMGLRPPCGVLVLGPPGTGKTMLAKALAGESGANFITCSGSDFTSKFFGSGPAKVKKLFALARKNAPCILFVDEADGIGMRSSEGNVASNESNRIVNQWLVEMDGFEANQGVIVVGATNLMQHMDAALLREGRFDRKVTVHLPDVQDRVAIFELYAKGVSVSPDVRFERFSRLTIGLSPAAIAQVVNQAGLLAAKAGRGVIEASDFSEAIEISRIGALTGGQRALQEHEKRRITVHELGHALVSASLGFGIVEKVTILPRGGALGVTLVTHQEDRKLVRQQDLENQIKMLLGGRNAEKLIFADVSTGASQDLEEASKLAFDMVSRYAMGPQNTLFSLGALPLQLRAEATAQAVERAEAVLQRLNAECVELLSGVSAALNDLTVRLLEEESLDGTVVYEALRAKPLRLPA